MAKTSAGVDTTTQEEGKKTELEVQKRMKNGDWESEKVSDVKKQILIFIFNIFINDLCNAISHSRYLLFADDIKIFRAIKSPYEFSLLQSDIDSVQNWRTAIFMKLNISKTRVISFSRKTIKLIFHYKLCHSSITRIDSITDLGVFTDSELHFHNHVDYIFSQCIKFLGLVQTITFPLSSLGSLHVIFYIN
jgi:hypothetical protein